MAREPKPVKFFIGLLANCEELFPAVDAALSALLGPVDLTSPTLPWEVTDYYREEMGSGLLRRFVSIAPLISPERLAEIKLGAQELEESFQESHGTQKGRAVNIDPGYLDAGKVVLASTKGAAHRLYLRSGIYAETTLLFRGGCYQPLTYTYKDYLWPETLSFFTVLRALYLRQLRQGEKAPFRTQ